MPRHFFRSISPSRRAVSRQGWLRPVRQWLDHPDLWAVRRRSVAPGIALGLFWMWIPIPAHSAAAAISAIALRVHLPLSILMTAIVNPLTILPLYFAGYRVGRGLLQLPERPFSFEFSYAWFAAEFSAIWQPLLLGCSILAITCATLGYLIVDLLWRSRIGRYLERRRRRSQPIEP